MQIALRVLVATLLLSAVTVVGAQQPSVLSQENSWKIEQAQAKVHLLTVGLVGSMLMTFLTIAGGYYAIKRGRREDGDAQKKQVLGWVNENHSGREFVAHAEKQMEKVSERCIAKAFHERGPTFTDVEVTNGLEKRVSNLELMHAANVAQGATILKALGSVEGQLATLIHVTRNNSGKG